MNTHNADISETVDHYSKASQKVKALFILIVLIAAASFVVGYFSRGVTDIKILQGPQLYEYIDNLPLSKSYKIAGAGE